MKKILLLIIGISFFSISSIAQSQAEVIYQDDKIKVEMSKQDCNYNNNAISHTYGIIKYTNLTNNELELNFELELWYNNVKQDATQGDLVNEELSNTIHLGPNEIIEGSCNTKESFLRVLAKHNHPRMDIKLTDINFVINKIK
ncbi:MAG: hypothetical protein ACPG4Y_02965 [Chitinophagales bacterium]